MGSNPYSKCKMVKQHTQKTEQRGKEKLTYIWFNWDLIEICCNLMSCCQQLRLSILLEVLPRYYSVLCYICTSMRLMLPQHELYFPCMPRAGISQNKRCLLKHMRTLACGCLVTRVGPTHSVFLLKGSSNV